MIRFRWGELLQLLLELEGRAITKARAWPIAVVILSPLFDEDSSFDTISEPFEVQTFVSEFPVEALVGTILPRFARIDQRSFEPGLPPPGNPGGSVM